MTQIFPFTDPDPGWAAGVKLKSSDLKTISKNAAQAADGVLWSDIAVLKNWRRASLNGGGACAVWEPSTKRWINAYAPSGNPGALFSYDGLEEWLSLTVTAGTNWNATSAIAADGAGTVILGGGGGSATASKIRQSSDGGNTWAARSTNASSTESVTCAAWHAAASKFVIGMSNNSNTNIETSPNGITWTAQTALVGPRSALASNGSTIVCLFSTSTNFCVSSADTVAWTFRTLPASALWNAIAWNARSGKFMAIGQNVIATSSDGATWSSSGLTAPFNNATSDLAAMGRAWIAVGTNTVPINQIAISYNDGVSWLPVKSLSIAGARLAVGDNQVLAVISNASYATLRGGS